MQRTLHYKCLCHFFMHPWWIKKNLTDSKLLNVNIYRQKNTAKMNCWQIYVFNFLFKLKILLIHLALRDIQKFVSNYIYIYIYAFSRRFYPKRLTLHSSYSFTFYQLLLSLGSEPMIVALVAPCSTICATGKLYRATGKLYRIKI